MSGGQGGVVVGVLVCLSDTRCNVVLCYCVLVRYRVIRYCGLCGIVFKREMVQCGAVVCVLLCFREKW